MPDFLDFEKNSIAITNLHRLGILDLIQYLQLNEFSQKEFAGYLGVSYSTLQKYEYGITKPSNEFLYNLSEKFHINPKELIENDNDSFDFL